MDLSHQLFIAGNVLYIRNFSEIAALFEAMGRTVELYMHMGTSSEYGSPKTSPAVLIIGPKTLIINSNLYERDRRLGVQIYQIKVLKNVSQSPSHLPSSSSYMQNNNSGDKYIHIPFIRLL